MKSPLFRSHLQLIPIKIITNIFLFVNRQFTDDQIWCVLGSSKPNFPI